MSDDKHTELLRDAERVPRRLPPVYPSVFNAMQTKEQREAKRLRDAGTDKEKP
jgi:hypothetical protein